MRFVIAAMLVLVGLIHLLPAWGLLGQQQLARLYGLAFDEPNLEILMRHRAVLFGLLGLFLLLAAFKPELQVMAIVAGLVSVGSFIWLAWSVGGYNAELWRVVVADIAALVCLLVAIGALLLVRSGASGALAGAPRL